MKRRNLTSAVSFRPVNLNDTLAVGQSNDARYGGDGDVRTKAWAHDDRSYQDAPIFYLYKFNSG